MAVPENLDDLWCLKEIIAQGDRTSGKSYRRIRGEDVLRADKGERVPIFLEIKADKIILAKYANKLRIMGRIEKGPEDIVRIGSHHTLEVQPNDAITIQKDGWKRWELEMLKEAEKAREIPLVLIACIEEGEAELAILRKHGVDFVTRISSQIPGKIDRGREKSMKEFYKELACKIKEVIEKVDATIVCGPGFSKNNFIDFLEERYPEMVKKCFVENTGTGGKVGINEILKRGTVDKIVKNSRVSFEIKLVEDVFKEIGKDSGLATYGFEEVKKAIDYGAVEKLLITDIFLRKCKDSDKLMEDVRKRRGKSVIVSTDHEGGRRLQGIGGVACTLRFKIE
jgi:protein pelota